MSELSNVAISPGILLLVGPAGVGKTMYCRQFLVDGLATDRCLLISAELDDRRLRQLFSGDYITTRNFRFINPVSSNNSSLSPQKKAMTKSLSAALTRAREFISEPPRDSSQNEKRVHRSVRVVVDSLTYLQLICGEKLVMDFVLRLRRILSEENAMAILTISDTDQQIKNKLGALTDGIIEMRLEEDPKGPLNRAIRLLSLKRTHHKPVWMHFNIGDDGGIVFGERPSAVLLCTLCRKPVSGKPFIYSDFSFDTITCLETYRKLEGAYGTSVADTGLPFEATDVSFFFVDIVGLSNPNFSVKKQIQKIETLNELLASCVAFKKSPKEKRLILPTGDGMAVGFLLNPELALELSIELHQKLRMFNNRKPADDQIGIRIGLASGLVFAVTDMNNMQNVWGPGIILARRVMDVGDDGHILLADNLAERLIPLKDEYRRIIKPISDSFEIKHGQKIKLYSAYSHDFGNSELPARASRK